MGTRTFCDHCGNTLLGQYTTYEVGKSPRFIQQMVNVGAPVGGLLYGITPGQPHVVTAGSAVEIKVDLCAKCEPIWLSRVRKLTLSEEGS